MRRLRIAGALLLGLVAAPAKADMYQDASNASQPAAAQNVTSGVVNQRPPVSPDGLKVNVGAPIPAFASDAFLSAVTSQPTPYTQVPCPSCSFGYSQPFYVLHQTGTTPLTGLGMIGGIVSSVQQVKGTNTEPTGGSYTGLIGTAVARAPGGEGGVRTTLASPVSGGATAITVTSPTGFTVGNGIHFKADNGLVASAVITGIAGSTFNLDRAISWPAAAGATVVYWRGAVKGMVSESDQHTGSVNMGLTSVEHSVSARTGSLPAWKTLLLLTANNSDVVRGELYDSGIMLSRQSGGTSWRTGIGFSPIAGDNLVGGDGTLIKTFAGGYLNGIDFTTAAFTGNAFASPGFSVDRFGSVNIANTAPVVEYRITGTAVTAGGLWRTVGSGGSLYTQVNTAAAGDFSSSVSLVTLANGRMRLSGQNTGFEIQNSLIGVTAGGLWRFTANSGFFGLQANTAVAGDFSTVQSIITASDTGGVTMPGLPTSAGAGGLTVCVDTGGNLYKKAACP